MEREHLDTFFLSMGYQVMEMDRTEIRVFYRMENTRVVTVCVADTQDNADLTEEQINAGKEMALALFRSRGYIESHMMTLIVTDHPERDMNLSKGNYLGWMIDTNLHRLIIYENQMEDFYGLRKKLEKFLDIVQTGDSTAISRFGRKKPVPWVTIGILLVNTIIFIVCTLTGEVLYNKGAFSIRFILQDHQYYRFVSSMFLHANLMHLTSNMLLLVVVGSFVEKYCGKVLYTGIYLLSGMAGSCFSAMGELLTKSFSASVGASGAIMGIVGALLAIAVMHKGSYKEITVGRIIFMIAYVLYYGFTTPSVNNLAHIGGVVSGFLLTLLALLIKERLIIGKGSRHEN